MGVKKKSKKEDGHVLGFPQKEGGEGDYRKMRNSPTIQRKKGAQYLLIGDPGRGWGKGTNINTPQSLGREEGGGEYFFLGK